MQMVPRVGKLTAKQFKSPAKTASVTCLGNQTALENCLIKWRQDGDDKYLTHTWLAAAVPIRDAEPTVLYNDEACVLAFACMGRHLLAYSLRHVDVGGMSYLAVQLPVQACVSRRHNERSVGNGPAACSHVRKQLYVTQLRVHRGSRATQNSI